MPAVDALACILGKWIGLQSSEASAMGTFCVDNVPDGAGDQCNQKSNAPGGIGRQQDNADQTANAADKHACLLNQDGNFADHLLLLFR
jgi:hypothetical protein